MGCLFVGGHTSSRRQSLSLEVSGFNEQKVTRVHTIFFGAFCFVPHFIQVKMNGQWNKNTDMAVAGAPFGRGKVRKKL